MSEWMRTQVKVNLCELTYVCIQRKLSNYTFMY